MDESAHKINSQVQLSFAIDAVENIDAETFRSLYYVTNKPVLLRGFLRNWPAFRKWSPRHFADRFGQVEVQVMCDLDPDRACYGGPYGNRRTLSIGDLVKMIEHGASGSPYLVAQNHALRQPEFAELWRDLTFESGWFDAPESADAVSLWLGPRNTVTPLHFDLTNFLLAQVFGRKQAMLASPLDTLWLYNQRGGYSQVNPDRPDYDRFPLFARAGVGSVVVEAGDALFLPRDWWHHVRSLSASISLSLSNFAWPNPIAPKQSCSRP
jgi:ribosomal protein L16 Arg81 hydroxylase